jgi:hypothetical protein
MTVTRAVRASRPRWQPAALSWALWALAMLSLPVVAWLDHRSRQAGRPDLVQLATGSTVPPVLALVSAATIGVMLASRRPRHPVGWLLLILGLSLAASGVAAAYTAYGLVAPWVSEVGCHAGYSYLWISPPRTSQRRSRPKSAYSLLRHPPTAPASRGPGSGAGVAGGHARHSVAGRERAGVDRRSGDGQGLPADRPDPALSDGVLGRPHRCADDLGPGRAPHVADHSGELAVPIADQKPPRHRLIGKAGQQTAGLLGNPQPVRWSLTPARCTRRLPSSMTNSPYTPRRQIVSTVQQQQATNAGGLLTQERPPTRRGAGSRPWPRSPA